MPRLQYMPINDFDRGLVEKFESHDYEYNPANWDRLTKSLPESRNSRVKRYIWLPITGIAAAIALLIGVPMMMQRSDDSNTVANNKKINKTEIVTSTSSSASIAPQPASVIVPAEETTSPQASQSNTIPSASTTGINNQSITIPANQQLQNTQSANTLVNSQATQRLTATPPNRTVVSTTGSLYDQSVAPLEQQIVQSQSQEPITVRQNLQAVPPDEQAILRDQAKSSASIMMETMQRIDNGGSLGVDPDAIGLQRNKGTSLSLTGGYNQGTANVGYALGVNTRRNLGERIYIEGDVAFSSNRNAMQTTAMNTSDYDLYMEHAPQLLTNPGKAAAGEPTNEMYYLQVTPVFGYQVGKNWSLGAGPDMQRMFQNGEKTFYVVDEATVKPVPVMDYGLVGKTEYNLYKSFKAGVQYRYGMNNVLTPEKNYVNRSYLQVQLKIGILGSKK